MIVRDATSAIYRQIHERIAALVRYARSVLSRLIVFSLVIYDASGPDFSSE